MSWPPAGCWLRQSTRSWRRSCRPGPTITTAACWARPRHGSSGTIRLARRACGLQSRRAPTGRDRTPGLNEAVADAEVAGAARSPVALGATVDRLGADDALAITFAHGRPRVGARRDA